MTVLCFFFLDDSSIFTLVGVGIEYPEGCYATGDNNIMTLSGPHVLLEDCLYLCAVSCLHALSELFYYVCLIHFFARFLINRRVGRLLVTSFLKGTNDLNVVCIKSVATSSLTLH